MNEMQGTTVVKLDLILIHCPGLLRQFAAEVAKSKWNLKKAFDNVKSLNKIIPTHNVLGQ